MKSDFKELSNLIVGMRHAYARGDNAMAWAREHSTRTDNTILSTLIAYDLQAGSYVAGARANPDYVKRWCTQLASLIRPYLESGNHVLEVGAGEATTLVGLTKATDRLDLCASGLDVSWSRIKVAQRWATENSVAARLFVGDLFHIPLADNSIDVVYTSHSLEPNGGREAEAITELLRVARKAVVLVEPIYELASEPAQKRMTELGYVRNLKLTAETLGATVVEYGLLDVVSNPLNPSGVVLLAKHAPPARSTPERGKENWQCPLTAVALTEHADLFYAEQAGVAYPIMRGVPLLRAEHAIVASNLSINHES
jgi:SAM-dependent methyltransferase